MRVLLLFSILLLSFTLIEGKKRYRRYFDHEEEHNEVTPKPNAGDDQNTNNTHHNPPTKNKSSMLIPLKKVSVDSGKSYELDSLYVFSMNILQDQPSQVNAIVDTQSNDDWILDSTCKNCGSNQGKGFTCQSQECQDVSSYSNETLKLLDGKIRAIKFVPTSLEASIEKDSNFTLDKVNDIIKIKNGSQIKYRQAYLDQVQAGLGFGLDSSSGSFQSIAEAKSIKKNKFTLIFQKEAGMLIIGSKKKYLSNTSNSTVFHVSQSQYQQPESPNQNFKNMRQINNGNNSSNINDSPDISDSWRIKVGPFLKVGQSPEISSQNKEQPDVDNASLYEGKLDSTTKYIILPFGVWTRIDKTMFEFNECNTDNLESTVCNCKGSWQPISFQFIKDPSNNSLQNNTQNFEFLPTSYLEPIKGGISKCLLLIKPQESDANIDYVFGTSFLQNYYSVYNFDDKTITLGPATDFALSLSSSNGLSLWWVLFALGLALVLLGLLCCLCRKRNACHLCQQHHDPAEHNYEQPIATVCEPHGQNQPTQAAHQTTISYLVRSPRTQDPQQDNYVHTYQTADYHGQQQQHSESHHQQQQPQHYQEHSTASQQQYNPECQQQKSQISDTPQTFQPYQSQQQHSRSQQNLSQPLGANSPGGSRVINSPNRSYTLFQQRPVYK